MAPTTTNPVWIPHPQGQAHPPLLRQGAVQRVHRLDNAQAGPDRPLGLIVMGLRVTKVDEQPVAQMLRDLAPKALDHLRTGGLVGLEHRQQVFRIELASERCRAHQIADQHRELAAFGFRGREPFGGPGQKRYVLVGWRRGGGQYLRRTRTACPHQDTAILVGRQPPGIDQFGFEVVQIGVVEAKPAL